MYRIGIDLGGTNIAAGIVGERFDLVGRVSLPTGASRAPDEIAADMARACRAVCAETGVPAAEIEAVGVAAPGIVDHDAGVIEYCCNLPFRRYPLCARVAELLSLPRVSVENDANAAAWGEAVAGAARGTRDSILITLGTGVGGGVIIDGRIFSGFNYAGAELGHMVIRAGGEPCGCGRRGCWEAYSSATALIRMTRARLDACRAERRPTAMTDVAEAEGRVSGRTAFTACRAGDGPAGEVVAEYLSYLAEGLANIINIFRPEVLSLGGGVSNEGAYLLDRLVPLVRERVYGQEIVRETEIRVAALGNDAGIIGAALLGLPAEG